MHSDGPLPSEVGFSAHLDAETVIFHFRMIASPKCDLGNQNAMLVQIEIRTHVMARGIAVTQPPNIVDHAEKTLCSFRMRSQQVLGNGANLIQPTSRHVGPDLPARYPALDRKSR